MKRSNQLATMHTPAEKGMPSKLSKKEGCSKKLAKAATTLFATDADN
jgi:hypothetical protein